MPSIRSVPTCPRSRSPERETSLEPADRSVRVSPAESVRQMAGRGGLEPPPSRLTAGRTTNCAICQWSSRGPSELSSQTTVDDSMRRVRQCQRRARRTRTPPCARCERREGRHPPAERPSGSTFSASSSSRTERGSRRSLVGVRTGLSAGSRCLPAPRGRMLICRQFAQRRNRGRAPPGPLARAALDPAGLDAVSGGAPASTGISPNRSSARSRSSRRSRCAHGPRRARPRRRARRARRDARSAKSRRPPGGTRRPWSLRGIGCGGGI